jgi:hypothetical protein
MPSLASCKLLCVDPAHVDKLWPIVSGLIKKAIDRGFLQFAEVEKSVLSGDWLLWLVVDSQQIRAALVTMLTHDACEIVALSGFGAGDWIHLIKGIEKYARAEGRARVRIIGRKGWARLLPDYQQAAVVLERHL